MYIKLAITTTRVVGILCCLFVHIIIETSDWKKTHHLRFCNYLNTNIDIHIAFRVLNIDPFLKIPLEIMYRLVVQKWEYTEY